MSLFHCRFCDHDNPPGARFCNACGSPLYLKPCSQCDAVNESAATQCYQCGAPLPAGNATEEALIGTTPALSSAVEAAPGAEVERGNAAGSFAERFEVEFGEFRPSLFESTSPERGAGTPAIGDLRRTSTSADAAQPHESFKRTGLAPMGALLILALVIIGAGVYYAYEHTGARVAGADVVAASHPPAQEEPAAETKATVPTNEASTPTATNVTNEAPALAPPESAEPTPAPPVPRRSAPHAVNKGTAAQPAKSAAPSDASAIATQRIIERELGIRAAPAAKTRAP
jgi:ribosomal protein L40E